MINLYRRLSDREEPIEVGVIGAGLFGTKLVDQIARVPGMRTAVIADLSTDRATEAYDESGVDEAVTTVNSVSETNEAIGAGTAVITDDPFTLIDADVDVVVEATGVPDAGAHHAYEAIRAGKHVVMVTVEADTVVGPILAEMARNAGVTYSLAYGDQPALIVELFDWAGTVGLDVVAAGKGNPYREEYRTGTPEDVFERFGYDESFAAEYDLNPKMYNSFLDGTKVAVEMCSVANATGLTPDVPGMHFPTAEIPEIPNKLRPEDAGGLLEGTGVVETISTLHPDGTSVEQSISFGVFIVTTTPNEAVREYVAQNAGEGLYVSDCGDYQVFYRPHHLPGIETTISVATAALDNQPTGAPTERIAEVVGAAKRDLDPGEELDGGGGYTVYGRLERADRADEHGFVPFELLDGAEVTRPVEQDEIVTVDDVSIDRDSFIYSLRQLQDYE